MVDEIDGVVYEFPVATAEPPVLAVYQFTVPALAVAPRLTAPLPHSEAGVVEVMVGIDFTVAVIAVLVVEVHPPLVAST